MRLGQCLLTVQNKFVQMMQMFICPYSYNNLPGSYFGLSNLDSIFNPKSIALIGASDEEGSVGYI